MSIFKRGDQGSAQQTSTATAVGAQVVEQTGKLPSVAPPPPTSASAARSTAAPGVVPPPAAPIYSMRPEPAPRASAPASVQPNAQAVARAAAPRTKPAATPPRMVPARRVQAPVNPAVAQPFDPVHAAQAALLHLAWSWQQAGAPIRAIHAYMQLLDRYPDSAAADAAVADLAELSNKLVQMGQFHTALGIYELLEDLQECPT